MKCCSMTSAAMLRSRGCCAAHTHTDTHPHMRARTHDQTTHTCTHIRKDIRKQTHTHTKHHHPMYAPQLRDLLQCRCSQQLLCESLWQQCCYRWLHHLRARPATSAAAGTGTCALTPGAQSPAHKIVQPQHHRQFTSCCVSRCCHSQETE